MAAGDYVEGWIITLLDFEYDKECNVIITNPADIQEKMIEIMEIFESYQGDVEFEYRQNIIDHCVKSWDPSMNTFIGNNDPDDNRLHITICKATLKYELKLEIQELGWHIPRTKSAGKE